jgi:hypothetical protein
MRGCCAVTVLGTRLRVVGSRCGLCQVVHFRRCPQRASCDADCGAASSRLADVHSEQVDYGASVQAGKAVKLQSCCWGGRRCANAGGKGRLFHGHAQQAAQCPPAASQDTSFLGRPARVQEGAGPSTCIRHALRRTLPMGSVELLKNRKRRPGAAEAAQVRGTSVIRPRRGSPLPGRAALSQARPPRLPPYQLEWPLSCLSHRLLMLCLPPWLRRAGAAGSAPRLGPRQRS